MSGYGFGAVLGSILLVGGLSLSKALQPGLNLVEVEPSDIVFEVDMFEKEGQQRESRLNTDELRQSGSLNAKRVVVPNRWVTVRPGLPIFPGVREARPTKKVFTASTADYRIVQEVSAPTKEGSSFTIVLSYNARIEGRGTTPEAIATSQRENAAKFIATTLGAVPRNQVHIEVEVKAMLENRAKNIFNEILAPIAQRYEQLQIGSNKAIILQEVEKQASERIYDQFGITISGLTYGGTVFPSSTQEKIDGNALAPVLKETSTTKALTEQQRARESVLRQQAFNGKERGSLFIEDQKLDALEAWIEAMKQAVQQETIKSPKEILPDQVRVNKTL